MPGGSWVKIKIKGGGEDYLVAVVLSLAGLAC